MDFREWLGVCGLTEFALAKVCNISRGTIKNLRSGKNPNIKTVKRIIRATKNFKVPATYALFKNFEAKGENLWKNGSSNITKKS